MRTHIAFPHFVAGRIAEALTWSELTSSERPDHPFNIPILAACYAIAGRQEEAEKIMARLRQLYPALRLSNLSPFTRSATRRSTSACRGITKGRAAGMTACGSPRESLHQVWGWRRRRTEAASGIVVAQQPLAAERRDFHRRSAMSTRRR